MSDKKQINGMWDIRKAVIELMEKIPEFDALKGESWYIVEDCLVLSIERTITILKEHGLGATDGEVHKAE